MDSEAVPDFPVRPGIVWEVNARLEAQDTTKKWYRAKIIGLSESEKQVLVHFDGWNARWDSWFNMNSEQLRPVSKIADWRDKRRDNKSPFKVNQRVLARWKGMSFYPAKITGINESGTFRVLFHDGVEQNTKYSDMKHATQSELNKVEQEIETRQWLLPQVAEGKRARKATKPDDAFIITEPILRRKSTETAKTPEETAKKNEPTRTKKNEPSTSSTTPVVRKYRKQKTYLKLGEALPDDPVKRATAKGYSPNEPKAERSFSDQAAVADATEESYSSFKASLPKRKRRESQPASGRSSPTEPVQREQEEDESVAADTIAVEASPPKVKIRTALHAKMARVREVCHKWKKDREKKSRKVFRIDALPISGEETESASESGSIVDKLSIETVEPEADTKFESEMSVVDTEAETDVVKEKKKDKEKRKERSKEKRKEKTVITSTPARLTPPPAVSPSLSLSIPTSVDVLEASPVVSLTRLPEPEASASKPSPTIKEPDTPKSIEQEIDRNKFPCPHCSRGFRKENLLNYHLKYYHAEEGTGAPVESVVPVEELATARRKPDPDRKRHSQDDETRTGHHHRKRGRYDLDRSGDSRSSFFSKRRSEDGVRPGNILIDTKRMSADSCEPDPAWDLSLNQSDLSSSIVSNVDLSSSRDFSREIKKEDSIYDDFPGVSDSEFSVKTERERYDSAGIDSIVSEDQESIQGEERRGEVVNCICGLAEENGFMIQCEVCLCWQHAICIRLSEDKLPAKYICWVCVNPPGVRDSMRYIHDQDWLKEGQLVRFSYLARTRESMRRAPLLKALASLLGDVHNLNNVLSALRRTSDVASQQDHPDLEHIYSGLQESLTNGVVPESLPNEVVEETKPERDSALVNQDSVDCEVVTDPTPNTNNNSNECELVNEVVTVNTTVTNETSSDGLNDLQNDIPVIPKENGDTVETDVDNGVSEVDNDDANNDVDIESTSNVPVPEVTTNNDDQTPTEESCNEYRPANGNSALSDHSYQQIDEHKNAVAFSNSLSASECNKEPGTASAHDNDNDNEDNNESAVMADSGGGEIVNDRCSSVGLYVSRQQDLIDERLDLIEEEIVKLEQIDTGHPVPSDFDPLMDIVGVKKSLRNLIHDLNKVKRMATYSGHRR